MHGFYVRVLCVKHPSSKAACEACTHEAEVARMVHLANARPLVLLANAAGPLLLGRPKVRAPSSTLIGPRAYKFIGRGLPATRNQRDRQGRLLAG